MTVRVNEGWELAFVLPNLILPSDNSYARGTLGEYDLSLNTTFLRIVPSQHPLVHDIVRRSRAAKILLNRFTTSSGDKICPAVLLVRSDAPERILRSPEPTVAFRNAIAFSHLLFARSRHREVRWSDHFDFHSTGVSRRGDELITYSPAVLGGGIDLRTYHAMAAEYLAVHEYPLQIDDYLYIALGKAWHKRFVNPGSDDRFTRHLFRSLEVAYEAFSVRHKNYGSLYEVGLSTALLVSAIEILAAPDNENVKKKHVLDLLNLYQWENPRLKHRRYRVYVEKRQRQRVFRWVNQVQRVYDRLYEARSKFLHGDRVNKRLLIPFPQNPNLSLLRLTALVYRAALGAYLEQHYQRTERPYELKWLLYNGWVLREYEKDFLRAFDLEAE